MGPRLWSTRFRLERGSNSGPLDQKASAKHSEQPELHLVIDDVTYVLQKYCQKDTRWCFIC